MKVIFTDDGDVFAIKGNEYKEVKSATEDIYKLVDKGVSTVDAAKKVISDFEDLSGIEPEKWYAPFEEFFGLNTDTSIIYQTYLNDFIW